MKVTMLRTELGQDVNADGIALPQKRYLKGETYQVNQELGNCFLDMKAAIPAEKPKAEKPEAEEVKSAKGPSENKARKAKGE